MSGTGPQLKREPGESGGLNRRSPLAHLLHALNQPLTGLQCSLELAAAGPRRADQYVQTLRDGLELTARMRDLVEALRELVDLEQSAPRNVEALELRELLRESIEELCPVAAERNVRFDMEIEGEIAVEADPRQFGILMFRVLEPALSLAAEGGDVRIRAATEANQIRVTVSWRCGPLPRHSPFSRPELGLLIAQAGWEQAGAAWSLWQTDNVQSCAIRLAQAPQLSLEVPRVTETVP